MSTPNFGGIANTSSILTGDPIHRSDHVAPEISGRHLGTWSTRTDADSITEPSVSCRTLVHIWESRTSLAKSHPVTPPREDKLELSSIPKSPVSTCEGLATPEESHQLRRQQSLSTSEGSDLSAAIDSSQDEPPLCHEDSNLLQEDKTMSGVVLPLKDSSLDLGVDTQPLKSVKELSAKFGHALCPSCGTSFRLTAELFADDESTASAGTRCGGGSHPAADAAGEMGTIPEPSTVGSNPEQKAGKVLRLISTAAALVLLIAAGSNARVLKTRRPSERHCSVESPNIKDKMPAPSYPAHDNYYSVAPPTSKMFPVQPPPSFSISRG